MEFLVEFDVHIPDDAPANQVDARQSAEAVAAARLVEDGHLVRLWRLPAVRGETRAIGIYRADSQAQLDRLLRALPLYDWMRVTVTALEAHPNDPAAQATVPATAASRA